MSTISSTATPVARSRWTRAGGAVVPVVAILVLFTGCASSGPRSLHAHYAPFAPSRIMDVATGEVIPVEQSLLVDRAALRSASSLYELVQRQRPAFLHARGMRAGDGLHESEAIGVYIDGAYAGGVEALRQVPLTEVASVHRLSPGVTLAHLNRSHASGSLYVLMRR